MSKKIITGFVTCICMMALFLTMPFVSRAEEQKVRIGYIDYRGFIEPDSNGDFVGYGVDYLNEVAKYTNWKYEFVYDTWENCLSKLKTGEIDFVCSAQQTPERLETYDFSKYPIGMESSLVCVRSDDERIYYNDYVALNGKRIGMLKGNFQNNSFADYAKEHNFSYQALTFDSDRESFEALCNQQVDVMVTGSLSGHDDVRVADTFGSEPFYFMTRKHNEALLVPLNKALAEIKTTEPEFESELYKKYYNFSAKLQQPLFTREEVEYIKQSPILTVGNLPNRYPLSQYYEKTGELLGITEDILKLISEKSGLRFDLQPLPVGKKPMAELKARNYDLVAGVLRTDNFLNDPELSLSESFLDGKLVIVGRTGEILDLQEPHTIVMTTAFQGMQEYIQKEYPQYKIIYRDSNDKCLRAVKDKKADLMLQNSFVLSYWLQNPRFSGLEIVPTYSLDEQTCIAANHDSDPRLISVLSKTIKILDSETIDQYIVKHTIAKPYKLTLNDVCYKYRIPLVFLVLLFVLCIALYTYVIIQRQHHVNLLQQKNEQLIEAIEQAEHANRAKSTFLSRMSHEIRTPMNAIVGITAIAGKHLEEPKKMEEYLSKITFSSKVLLNIINDVLDMSAIESDKLKISNNSFDFKQLLSSISAMYYPQCKQKEIDFDLRLDGVTEETLVGDQLRVNQILLNLLSNAVKFTPKDGKIRLTVSQLAIREQQVFMQFTVSDTGCGMSADLQKRLFRPFEQEDSTTAQKYGGSGLGLSITKNLVDIMNGIIKVESVLDQGTTFTVELPFGLSEQRTQQDVDKMHKIRALIVDDDPDTCEHTSIVLTRIGVEHDRTTSGEEAIELITKAYECGHGYDVCFLDWKMPGIDGIEITKKIRELYNQETIIIMVSAYDLNEIEDQAKAAGANMFIPKPLFQSTVFNVLMGLSKGGYTKVTAEVKNYDFTGRRILLAEDNELNMEIAVELLSMVGADVDQAVDGQEVCDMFEASTPEEYDVILMDIQMPIRDGYEATKLIRSSSHERAREIPILAMTANAFTEDVSAALAAGMNGHIAKPIDTEILYSTIQSFFK